MIKYYKKWLLPLTLPAILLFVLVILIPFVTGIINSFADWRGTYFVGGDNAFEAFVGLKNYIAAFNNKNFVDSFIYTFKYTLLAVIFINAVALALALMVSKLKRGAGLFRSAFFLPYLLGGLALGFIWQFIFDIIFTNILFSETGILHAEFMRFMTQDPDKFLVALTIMTTWQYAGYYMIIYVTGLNNIPQDLYEAAAIDGATPFQQFRRITVPMLMPAITVVLFLILANSFKLLDQNVALTDGQFGTRMLALNILRVPRDRTPPDYGLAQAEAVIFFIVIAIITFVQVRITKKREVEM